MWVLNRKFKELKKRVPELERQDYKKSISEGVANAIVYQQHEKQDAYRLDSQTHARELEEVR